MNSQLCTVPQRYVYCMWLSPNCTVKCSVKGGVWCRVQLCVQISSTVWVQFCECTVQFCPTTLAEPQIQSQSPREKQKDPLRMQSVESWVGSSPPLVDLSRIPIRRVRTMKCAFEGLWRHLAVPCVGLVLWSALHSACGMGLHYQVHSRKLPVAKIIPPPFFPPRCF